MAVLGHISLWPLVMQNIAAPACTSLRGTTMKTLPAQRSPSASTTKGQGAHKHDRADPAPAALATILSPCPAT